MRAPNRAAADMHGGGSHLIRPQQMHEPAAANDICQRIHCADLMEMDLRNRYAMRMALRLANQAVNLGGMPAHLLRQREPLNPAADIRIAGMRMGVGVIVLVAVLVLVAMLVLMAVLMLVAVLVLMAVLMAMLVLMAVLVLVAVLVNMCMEVRVRMPMRVDMGMPAIRRFLFAAHQDTDMRSPDAAFLRRFGRNGNAGDTQRIHLPQEALLVFIQLKQGAHEHIARRAHGTVQIKRFHRLSILSGAAAPRFFPSLTAYAYHSIFCARRKEGGAFTNPRIGGIVAG